MSLKKLFSGHKRGSKTRQERMKTAARANYNKRRGIAGDKYVNPNKAKASGSAAPKASPAPKARPAAKKTGTPSKRLDTKGSAPKKASTGGPARYKSGGSKTVRKAGSSAGRKTNRSVAAKRGGTTGSASRKASRGKKVNLAGKTYGSGTRKNRRTN